MLYRINGNAARTCLLQTVAATQSLQGLQLQRNPRTDHTVSTTHLHIKERYNKNKK
jgi:hypothetical protein